MRFPHRTYSWPDPIRPHQHWTSRPARAPLRYRPRAAWPTCLGAADRFCAGLNPRATLPAQSRRGSSATRPASALLPSPRNARRLRVKARSPHDHDPRRTVLMRSLATDVGRAYSSDAVNRSHGNRGERNSPKNQGSGMRCRRRLSRRRGPGANTRIGAGQAVLTRPGLRGPCARATTEQPPGQIGHIKNDLER